MNTVEGCEMAPYFKPKPNKELSETKINDWISVNEVLESIQKLTCSDLSWNMITEIII